MAPAEPRRQGRLSRAWTRLRWSERIALIALGVFTLVAVLAPLFAPYDAQVQVGKSFSPPSWAHPFGTDDIGRDLLSRVIYGIRLTWFPAIVIIGLGLALGTLLGLLSGAFGGGADRFIQRLTDLFLILPSTLIALAVVAALGPGTQNMVIAITLFWWPWYSRIVRARCAPSLPNPTSRQRAWPGSRAAGCCSGICSLGPFRRSWLRQHSTSQTSSSSWLFFRSSGSAPQLRPLSWARCRPGRSTASPPHGGFQSFLPS